MRAPWIKLVDDGLKVDYSKEPARARCSCDASEDTDLEETADIGKRLFRPPRDRVGCRDGHLGVAVARCSFFDAANTSRTLAESPGLAGSGLRRLVR